MTLGTNDIELATEYSMSFVVDGKWLTEGEYADIINIED